MRTTGLVTVALTSTLCAGSVVIPSEHSSSSDRTALYRRSPQVPGISPDLLPALASDELKFIEGIFNGVYEAYKTINKADKAIKFVENLKVTEQPQTFMGLAKKVKPVLNRLDQTPGRPLTVVLNYIEGIGTCLIEGKSFGDSVECGKTKVRQLPGRMNIEAPEPCNNFLGQLEIPGTGWPAKCHDPNIEQHPAGNSRRRAVIRAVCKFIELATPEKHLEAGRRRGEKSCEERYPTDAKIEADKAEKKRIDDLVAKAKTDLPAHLSQVQKKVNGGGVIEKIDIEKLIRLISQVEADKLEKTEVSSSYSMAANYLSSLKAPQNQAAWIAATVTPAQTIPEDKAGSSRGAKMISGFPFPDGLFNKNPSTAADDKCYSLLGLIQEQPDQWKLRYDALNQLDRDMLSKKISCRACQGKSGWSAKCGSMAAGGKAAQPSTEGEPQAPEPKAPQQPAQGEPKAPSPEAPQQADPKPKGTNPETNIQKIPPKKTPDAKPETNIQKIPPKKTPNAS
ncbi:hypothetical protein AAL_03447 [Moelleriella libera RCEF 2490]|uniref:Heat-labile enterotoxin IIA, A chain n=1 Tax=Moelleriella libera RCEF 2490 TaxID=1081109 RepID=A0A168D8K8_9HYPO|nr:hypothetical protein AAL_03447 [Moelleriella libera RCEF 2490]